MEPTEKGVCRLSLVSVRENPTHRSEMTTQLLFGDHYEVIDQSEDKGWFKIRIHFDAYQGWISNRSHYRISQEYFEQINNSDYKICTDHSATIFFKKHYIHVLLGSVLPISTNELFRLEEQLAFDGMSKSLSQRRDFEFLKEMAFKYMHAPYLWGGKTPFGIDCSGFTQQVFKICGYGLKRDSSEQALQGEEVQFQDRKPGDLAFFVDNNQKISHVGIVLEQDKVIHASGSVRIDGISEKGIFNEEQNEQTHQLISVRRIIKHRR